MGCFTKVKTYSYMERPRQVITTLVRKIALDWAKLIHPRHSTKHETGLSADSDGWIKELTCVILLDLSKIKQRQNIAGAIEEQQEIEKDQTTALVDLIRRNEMKTLLILDGLNTYNEATSQFITEIIHRQQMTTLTLLVTSRYPRSFHFPSKNQSPESEFILRGFSEDGIGYYTEKYVMYRESRPGNQASLQTSILNRIMESSHLKELVVFPAFLMRMVSLFKEPTWRSKDDAQIYMELIMYLCGRYNKKFMDTNCKKHKKIMMGLGSVAVASVEKDRMREELTYEEVMKVIDKETWELGFLCRNLCAENMTTVSYLHVNIQQYFIAYYMANTNKQAQTEKLIKFCRAAEVLKKQKLIFEIVSLMGDKELSTYMSRIISDDRKKWNHSLE